MSTDQSETAAVYVVLIGDSGVSQQHLRCDHLAWGRWLVSRLQEAQFDFIQTAFSLVRTNTNTQPGKMPPLTTTAYTSRLNYDGSGVEATDSLRNPQPHSPIVALSETFGHRFGVPLVPGHPLTLSYAPSFVATHDRDT